MENPEAEGEREESRKSALDGGACNEDSSEGVETSGISSWLPEAEEGAPSGSFRRPVARDRRGVEDVSREAEDERDGLENIRM